MSLQWSDLARFLRLLKVEPFFFLVMFMNVVKRIPLDQMIEDKICRQKYELPEDYCRRLPVMQSKDDFLERKSTILAEVTHFNMYINIAITIPMLVMALFIGPFID